MSVCVRLIWQSGQSVYKKTVHSRDCYRTHIVWAWLAYTKSLKTLTWDNTDTFTDRVYIITNVQIEHQVLTMNRNSKYENLTSSVFSKMADE